MRQFPQGGSIMVESSLQPLNKTNLREHILAQLRSVILEGTYKPGDRLVELTIADQLQVSRAPVREALCALEQEGVVVQVPRRGYFVVDFDEKDLEEVYSLRLLLENEAVQRATQRAGDKDFRQMQRLVDAMAKAATDKQDPGTIVGLDLAFHELICRLADHSRLLWAWNSLRMQTQILVGVTSRTHYDHPDEPREWHQVILDAMRAKDVVQAQQILDEHVLDAKERARAALRKELELNGEKLK
jgi:DNA-binding GntR family transcriptional regulator